MLLGKLGWCLKGGYLELRVLVLGSLRRVWGRGGRGLEPDGGLGQWPVGVGACVRHCLGLGQKERLQA